MIDEQTASPDDADARPPEPLPEPFQSLANLITGTANGSAALIGVLILELTKQGSLNKVEMLKTLQFFGEKDNSINEEVRHMFNSVADYVDTYGDFPRKQSG